MKTRSQIKREREATNDILERFPILLCQYIFEHLKGEDLIQATLVNREWNKLAGESLQLKINYSNQRKLNRETITMLKKSKYRNIELYKIEPRYWQKVWKVLAAKAGSWKSVNLKWCHSYNCEMWLDIFQFIEPSVKELTISGAYHQEETMFVDSTWKFPKLKILRCSHSGNIFKCFAQCTSLVEFRCPWIDSPDMEMDVLALLRNNRNLKELRMKNNEELFGAFPFKLRKFTIDSLYGGTAPNLLNFLQPQALTLESLKVGVNISQECLEFILSMPKLSSFIADFQASTLEWKETFPANTSIKHFKCLRINNEMLHSLAQAAPALESLETEHYDVSEFPQQIVFPNIKKFEALDIHDDSQWPTGDGNFAILVFQRMTSFFDAIVID